MKIKQEISSKCAKKIRCIFSAKLPLNTKAITIIKTLSADFNVPAPKIEETCNEQEDAAYYLRDIQTIIVNQQKTKEENQLLEALLHEFAHHLQHVIGAKKTYGRLYCDRPEEIEANIFARIIKKQIFSAEGEMRFGKPEE